MVGVRRGSVQGAAPCRQMSVSQFFVIQCENYFFRLRHQMLRGWEDEVCGHVRKSMCFTDADLYINDYCNVCFYIRLHFFYVRIKEICPVAWFLTINPLFGIYMNVIQRRTLLKMSHLQLYLKCQLSRQRQIFGPSLPPFLSSSLSFFIHPSLPPPPYIYLKCESGYSGSLPASLAASLPPHPLQGLLPDR